MPKFEYNGEMLYCKDIEIEDIGQACLEAIDEQGMFYYLIIRTCLGQSSCLEFGPIIPDVKLLPDSTEIKFYRLDFNEQKISSIIKKFLSPKGKRKNQITDVQEISMNDALDMGVNLIDYMREFKDVSNY